MKDVYKLLALKLDEIPNGYPATESGVELKILAKLFTQEEADLAYRLSREPETAKIIATRLEREEREVFSLLKGMVKKGLIEAERGEGGLAFFLIPFVVGFYENQNAQIDKEFAQLFETYYHESLYKMMTMKPSVHRVIPIEKTIPLNIRVMPYEKASTYLDKANSWGVLNCICRVQKKLIGQGCHHSLENCLVFSTKPQAFDRINTIRAISKDEALEVLAQADREGLVHSTSNTQKDVTYICNCCTCSCGVLRGIVEYGGINSIASSDFIAQVDNDLCTGCGLCIDRCQFKALKLENDICQVDRHLCYGCGLCVSICPTGALTLTQKDRDEIENPPETEDEWQVRRAEARKKWGAHNPQ